MSTRKPHTAKLSPPPADAPAAVDASHNIWLAGLGAFAKAQAEGGKAFEALVRDGLAMQQKTQTLAQERLADATQRMGELTARARDGKETVVSYNATTFYDRDRKLQGVRPGAPNPFVLGQATVQRALTVIEECALATQAAWRAGREAPATAGPVVNAFFGPVLPGVPVTLSDVSTLDQGPGHARARVHLLIRGAPTHVDVAAKLIEGRYWRIEDIVYANGASLLNPQRR